MSGVTDIRNIYGSISFNIEFSKLDLLMGVVINFRDVQKKVKMEKLLKKIILYNDRR